MPCLTAFNLTFSWVFDTINIAQTGQASHACNANELYLEIPGVARFLAIADSNCIIIEKACDTVSFNILNTWLMGTVLAYLLQYHGYLVLHGSAVLVHGKALIFSGESGAGKSTMANALLQKGHSFITDDLLVFTKNTAGEHCLIPGPSQVKLWDDAMTYFNYDINNAQPVMLRTNKYTIPATNTAKSLIPVHAFYELHTGPFGSTFSCERLNCLDSLQTLMKNAYRYFMLKPLGKLQSFFNDCHALSKQVSVYKMTRVKQFDELNYIVDYLESTAQS